MKLERLQRWHWAIVAVIVGIALAQVQLDWITTDPLTRGNLIEDPQRFESWLLRQRNGRPWLLDVVVHRVRGASAGPFVVTARRVYDDGGVVTLVPITFVPPQPYKPQISLDYLSGPAAIKAIEKLNANPNPTVLDYLAAVRAAAGVTYRYAWWEEPWRARAAWTTTALLVIAGLWPTLINRLVYHRLTRPPSEAGIDLSKVRPPRPAPRINEFNPEELEREIACRLEEFEPGADAPLVIPQAAPARALCSTASDPAVVGGADRDAQEFGAKPDDYYPTAKRHTDREKA